MGLAADLPGEDHVDVERELVLLEGLAVEVGHAADPVAHDAGGVVERLGGGQAEALVEVAPSRVMTDWEHDRLPLVSRTKSRSPGRTKVCILRQTFTWSAPEFDRESEARTRPSFVLMPRQ